ncbi:MAG: YfhO family protein [Ruminococcus sp.]|nr:YfhO family protein [Ruminococcus sp.]
MAKATTNSKAGASVTMPKVQINTAGIAGGLKHWLYDKRFYFLAFFIPVVLTYIAYAIFGIAPFGEESVLCLDLNGQYVYYFEAIRDAFWGDGSLFYDWSRNLSGNFMGIIGYYLASPFTLIIILLPQSWMLTSLLIMQLAKLGAAAVTFGYFLRKRRGMEELPSLLFSTMYAMMAYAVIQLIDPMWIDGLVFLPLIMAGMEYLIDDGRRINYIIPLGMMFVANFYIGYMVAFFCVIYFVFYTFFGSDAKSLQGYGKFQATVRFVYSSAIGGMLAAAMILPVYFALQQGKFDFTEPDYSFQLQFDLVDLFAQLMPAQYDSVNVQGSPEIYCGTLTLFLLPLFYINKNISGKKKLGYTFMLLCMVLSMYIKPIDMMWHGGQVPNWLPYRYSFLVSFVLLNMAAVAFKNLKDVPINKLAAQFVVILIGMLFMVKINYEHIDLKKSMWVAIIFMLVYLVLLYILNNGKAGRTKAMNSALIVSMLLFVGGEATYNAVDSMRKIDKEVAYSGGDYYNNFIQNGRAIVDSLEEYDSGLYRAEKTYWRCVNDNDALGLRGISHSSSVMNTKIINFIETMGYCTHSYYTRYNGNSELADSLLGIKYVLNQESTTGQDNTGNNYLNDDYVPINDGYTYINHNGTNQTVKIYENTNALSIGYMASEDILKIDHLGNDNPFNSQNVFMSTLSGNTTFDAASGAISGNTEYYTPIALDEDPVISNITVSDYNVENRLKLYTAGEGDPTVDFHLTVPDEQPIYIYFKTENQKSVNLWLGRWDDALQNYNYEDDGSGQYGFFSAYFEGDNYTMMRLGSFEPGTRLSLRMTVANEYTIVRDFFFYTFQEDVFQQDIDKLKANQLNITEYDENYIKGTVTASEGQILMTSIPWEETGSSIEQAFFKLPWEGTWRVKVDGKSVDAVEVIKAFVGVQLEPGTHTVEFEYVSPGWYTGLILVIIAIALLVVFHRQDRRRNQVLIAQIKARHEAAAEWGGPVVLIPLESEVKAAQRAAETSRTAPKKAQPKAEPKPEPKAEEAAPKEETKAEGEDK